MSGRVLYRLPASTLPVVNLWSASYSPALNDDHLITVVPALQHDGAGLGVLLPALSELALGVEDRLGHGDVEVRVRAGLGATPKPRLVVAGGVEDVVLGYPRDRQFPRRHALLVHLRLGQQLADVEGEALTE